MIASDLKEQILNNEYVEQILEELGCNYVVNHRDYLTCSNPDGDNKSAIVVYLNDNLTTINFTRQLSKDKRTHDIFDLICFIKGMTFPESLKWACDCFGIDYYNHEQELPESLQILRMLKEMNSGADDEDAKPLKPISEKILSYYMPVGNKMFLDDNISLSVQEEFCIGYDPQTNRITIPIRDSLGTLCGIKGRIFGEPDEYNPKYLYIEPVAKTQILYGLYENTNYIKNSNYIFIFESEKSVLQCASNGVRNCVALAGKSISKTQMELIVRTGCIPIIALDKDVKKAEIQTIMSMFPESMQVYYIFDENDVMDNKQSPTDNWNNWEFLIKNNIYKRR